MHGLHCMADLKGCEPSRLRAHAALLAFATRAVVDCGLTVVAQQTHAFPPNPASPHLAGGLTLTLLLAESHLCIHTWPETAGVTLDVYVCNLATDNSAKAQRLMARLIAWFAPQQCNERSVQRGV
jgi:S-adenosylmethionine decarboxylase proenzyme